MSCCRDQSSFFEDKGVEPRFRSKLDDFKDSGYDRGHMVRGQSEGRGVSNLGWGGVGAGGVGGGRGGGIEVTRSCLECAATV
jgi:hypothetical protein